MEKYLMEKSIPNKVNLNAKCQVYSKLYFNTALISNG